MTSSEQPSTLSTSQPSKCSLRYGWGGRLGRGAAGRGGAGRGGTGRVGAGRGGARLGMWRVACRYHFQIHHRLKNQCGMQYSGYCDMRYSGYCGITFNAVCGIPLAAIYRGIPRSLISKRPPSVIFYCAIRCRCPGCLGLSYNDPQFLPQNTLTHRMSSLPRLAVSQNGNRQPAVSRQYEG